MIHLNKIIVVALLLAGFVPVRAGVRSSATPPGAGAAQPPGLGQVPSRCSGSCPLHGALKQGVRSAAADEFAAACQSEGGPGGPYGALRNSHQSEGLAGGRYGALEKALGICVTKRHESQIWVFAPGESRVH